jgi:hypothetical protein
MSEYMVDAGKVRADNGGKIQSNPKNRMYATPHDEYRPTVLGLLLWSFDSIALGFQA